MSFSTRNFHEALQSGAGGGVALMITYDLSQSMIVGLGALQCRHGAMTRVSVDRAAFHEDGTASAAIVLVVITLALPRLTDVRWDGFI